MSGGQRGIKEIEVPYEHSGDTEPEQQDSIYLSIINRLQQKVCSITYRLSPALTSGEEEKTNPLLAVASTKIEQELLTLDKSLDEIISRLVI